MDVQLVSPKKSSHGDVDLRDMYVFNYFKEYGLLQVCDELTVL